MLRTILSALVALALSLAVGGAAEARPDGPNACQFVDGFLAFRDALGEEIVGVCESDQTYDGDGHAQQATSEGTLFWDHRANLVSFHNGYELWMDGPGSIRSTVTIDALSDKYAQRTPVRAPAAAVLQHASLRAEDLDRSEMGGNWWYTDVEIEPLRTVNVACTPSRTDPVLGTHYSWLMDEANRRAVMQSLTAIPDDTARQSRALIEEDAAACDGHTEQTRRGTFVLHVSLEPFIELGDDSILITFAVENRANGQRHSTSTAYVRYGGLISGVTMITPTELPDDESRALLEQAARAAHHRIQTAAWYLRD